MRSLLKYTKNEKGQSLVLIALLMVVVMGFAVFGTDVGVLYSTKTHMQNAADAAALAGAQELPDDKSKAKNTAKYYAELNGAEKADTVVTTPYKGDPDKIEVVCKKNVRYSFARILGFTDSNVISRAVAEKSHMAGGPFDYALFSGSKDEELSLTGGELHVTGNIHTNNKFQLGGMDNKVEGKIKAVNEIEINGKKNKITTIAECQAPVIINNNGKIDNTIYSMVPHINMYDFSDLVEAAAADAGEVYYGDQTWDGKDMTIEHSVYIDGSLTVTGKNFTGKGTILVAGDIIFDGKNLEMSGESICFYSLGDITITGKDAKLKGLLYAPNGIISFSSKDITVYGRIIAKEITFNSSGLRVYAGEDDLAGLPGIGGVSLVE